jgi:hypothetical protein
MLRMFKVLLFVQCYFMKSVKTLVVMCTYFLYWSGKFSVGRLDWNWFVLCIRVKGGYHAHALHG